MEMRDFGRTGLRLSALGFGCGAVGGLMVRADAAEQERAVARALDAGINYFDTAVQYGDGQSERNLGRVLARLKPAEAVIGTKVRLLGDDFSDVGGAVVGSLEGSLARLGRERVDILYFHNPVTMDGSPGSLSVARLLEEFVPAVERLRDAGKVGFVGITAVGDTAALKAVLASSKVEAAQVVFNLLNPSAADRLPAGWPGQDYDGLLGDAATAGAGVVAIRVLAGGALSGSAERHPIASPAPAPIGSSDTYAGDLDRAQALLPQAGGTTAGLTDLATRYPLSQAAIGTILVGMASFEQFELALAAIERGAPSAGELARLAGGQR
ncbi:L-galactose dehydrogenase/L-glyceraldehyde 3-phosphate reductase [Stella humosa]|uniref:L-galactose dehydrogenase/L-glyceraldehyde 3-phosphate reductase n=1 Tax=Stella humosa TaxID=94 RepID=A0A3N1MDB6_9PROT|nr:aldo/keto reductase [Stella humosa]ROQ01721.1 L-galactose dehydrogenase/L-glyceraldehyde 3-phosphate reductase [Stella humosa]BBK32103.1 oxidoreductase [Stella humosa]